MDEDSRPTVFLVDDDASIRNALTRALRSAGFRVRSWASAESFLAEYDSTMHGCLLSDVMMPATDGLELAAALVQRNIELPIVFISAKPDANYRQAAERAGAIAFLSKPVDLAKLTEALRGALARDRTRRG